MTFWRHEMREIDNNIN